MPAVGFSGPSQAEAPAVPPASGCHGVCSQVRQLSPASFRFVGDLSRYVQSLWPWPICPHPFIFWGSLGGSVPQEYLLTAFSDGCWHLGLGFAISFLRFYVGIHTSPKRTLPQASSSKVAPVVMATSRAVWSQGSSGSAFPAPCPSSHLLLVFHFFRVQLSPSRTVSFSASLSKHLLVLNIRL